MVDQTEDHPCPKFTPNGGHLLSIENPSCTTIADLADLDVNPGCVILVGASMGQGVPCPVAVWIGEEARPNPEKEKNNA
jgi:hypothetical protein